MNTLQDLMIGENGEAFVTGKLLLDGQARALHYPAYGSDHIVFGCGNDSFSFGGTLNVRRLANGFYRSSTTRKCPVVTFPFFGATKLSDALVTSRVLEMSAQGPDLGTFQNVHGLTAADMGSLPQPIVTLHFEIRVVNGGLSFRYGGTLGETTDIGKFKSASGLPKTFEAEALVPWRLLLVRRIVQWPSLKRLAAGDEANA